MVQVRQSIVKCRKSPTVASRELGKVSIGYLSVTDDAGDLHIGERDAVRPEFMAVQRSDCGDHLTRRCSGLPRSNEKSNEASLRHRARGEGLVGRCQPVGSGIVMHMLCHGECNEHNCIE